MNIYCTDRLLPLAVVVLLAAPLFVSQTATAQPSSNDFAQVRSNSLDLRETKFAIPRGDIWVDVASDEYGREISRVRLLPEAGQEQNLLDDGMYHEILDVSPSSGLVAITTETADRQSLLFSRLPRPGERTVDIIDTEDGSRHTIAQLQAWDTVLAKWSDDGEWLAIHGQVGSGTQKILATWSRADDGITVVLDGRSEVNDFIPLDGGSIAFSGAAEVEGKIKWGIFRTSGSTGSPVSVSDILAAPSSLQLDRTTGEISFLALQEHEPPAEELPPSRLPRIDFHVKDSGNGTKVLWEDRELGTIEYKSDVLAVFRVADGVLVHTRLPGANSSDHLLFLAEGDTISEYDAEGRLLMPVALQGQTGDILFVDSPADIDQRRLNSGDPATWEQTLKVWNPMNGETRELGPLNRPQPPRASWTQDGDVLFIAAEDILRWKPSQEEPEVCASMVVPLEILALDNDRAAFTSVMVPGEDGRLQRGLFVLSCGGKPRLIDGSAAGARLLRLLGNEVLEIEVVSAKSGVWEKQQIAIGAK